MCEKNDWCYAIEKLSCETTSSILLYSSLSQVDTILYNICYKFINTIIHTDISINSSVFYR